MFLPSEIFPGALISKLSEGTPMWYNLIFMEYTSPTHGKIIVYLNFVKGSISLSEIPYSDERERELKQIIKYEQSAN